MSARMVPALKPYFAVLREGAVVSWGDVPEGVDRVSCPHDGKLRWYDTKGERAMDADVQPVGRAAAIEHEVCEIETLRSTQAYSEKGVEARAWLAAHPQDDGAMPNEGYLLDEMEVCGDCTAWQAATAIVTAADRVRAAERTRRERRVLVRTLDAG